MPCAVATTALALSSTEQALPPFSPVDVIDISRSAVVCVLCKVAGCVVLTTQPVLLPTASAVLCSGVFCILHQ